LVTVAVPLPPEALALLPVPLAAPVLEELDGLLLHAAVAAASASASSVAPTSHSLAPLPLPVTVDRVALIVGPLTRQRNG
jgi:hypothetical protein